VGLGFSQIIRTSITIWIYAFVWSCGAFKKTTLTWKFSFIAWLLARLPLDARKKFPRKSKHMQHIEDSTYIMIGLNLIVWWLSQSVSNQLVVPLEFLIHQKSASKMDRIDDIFLELVLTQPWLKKHQHMASYHCRQNVLV
jgi:hypothetical protein